MEYVCKILQELDLVIGMNIKKNKKYEIAHSSYSWWRVCFLVAVILLRITTYAQTTVNLTFCDSQQNGIPGLSVKCTACDSVFHHLTNANGQLTINIKSAICKQLQIQLNSNFYENTDTLIAFTKSIENQQIILKDKVQGIKQVEVVAFRRMAKNDAKKSVYRIDSHGLLKTTNAERALTFLPGIIANNGSYALIGQDRKCRIKIDNRDASAEELKAISAKDIERVEVREITENDDNNSAGEINIIKKKIQQPKVFARLSAWTGLLRPQTGTFDNFGYQSKKWDVTAMLNLVKHTQKSENHVTRLYTDQQTAPQHFFESRTINTIQDAEHVKINYFATNQLTITASAYHSGYPTDASNWGTDFGNTSFQRSSTEKIDHWGGYTNIGYKFSNRNTLTLKGNCYYYRYAILWDGIDMDDYRSAMREFTGELLWENRSRLFGHDHEINAGFKNIYRKNITSYKPNSHSDYSIQQLYLSDYYSFTKNLSAYVILKGESDNLMGQRHFAFLPSVRLNYNLAKAGSLALNYQRRYTRPSVDYLNTDTLFINDYTQTVGNADLRSQHNDAFSLSWRHQIRNTYLTISTNYEREADVISQIYAIPYNYNVTTYANIGRGDYVSLSANASKRFFKNRMNVSVALTGFYRAYHLDNAYREHTLIEPAKGWGWNGNLNLSYLSSKGWMYMLSGNYRPKSYSLNGTFYRNPQLFLTINKNLFKDKLELELSFLNSLVYFWDTRSNTYFKNMQQQSTRRLYANNITISVAWNIGKQFRSRRTASGISNDDITTKKGG